MPTAGLAAYAVLLGLGFGRLVDAVFSNSDAASPAVLADCLSARVCGHGRVVLGQISYYTTLWFDLLTRSWPFHRALWELGPYALSVGGVALLAWMSWRLAGAWAAMTTVVISFAASSAVLYATAAQAFHGTTWFMTIALGAFLALEATSPPGKPRRRVVAAIGLSIAAGVNLASDPLLALTGVVPLVAAPLLLWRRSRCTAWRRLAVSSAATALLAVAVGTLTTFAMRASGFATAPLNGGHLGVASAGGIGGRVLRLLDDLGALANVGSIERAGATQLPLRLIVIAVAVTAVGVALREARAGLRSSASPRDDAVSVYAAYWATATLALAAGFVLSDVPLGAGTPSARYTVGIVYAAAAIVPLRAARSRGGRVGAAIATSIFCALSCLSLARNHLAAEKARLPIVQYGGPLVRSLERQGLDRGFAGYWKAAPITWRSGERVLVAPVATCPRRNARRLCPYRLNSISSWYTPRTRTRSFLLVDPNTDGFGAALASLGRPERVERFGPLRVLVYAHDIAVRLRSAVAHKP
jgi:hypothetical protein